MKRIAEILIAFVAFALLTRAQQPAKPTRPLRLAIIHANVIPMTDYRLQTDMTLVVVDEHIVAVGKTKKTRIPPGTQIVDASGKYVLPGLWDMHVHLGDSLFDRNSNLGLFVANGITGIRIMEWAPEFRLWRHDAEMGAIVAPQMVIASKMIGFGDLSNPSEERVREEVRIASKEGADFIKVHDNVSRPSYFALIYEAKRLHLQIEGHTPLSMTVPEVASLGQRSIEHLSGFGPALENRSVEKAWFAELRRNRTWQCPTLVMRQNYARLNDPSFMADPRLEYVKPAWKVRWLRLSTEAMGWPATEAIDRQRTITMEQRLVGDMQRAGIGILAGTDDGNPYVIPGFGLHDELKLLVKSGLTPIQALRTATYNPAKFLGLSRSMGTIASGKSSNVVLLDANPLEDISNTAKIFAVISRGRYYSRSAIEEIRARVAAAAKTPAVQQQ